MEPAPRATAPRPMSSVHTPQYRRLLQRLKEARQRAQLTQEQVAEALGRTQSFVSKCESGERRIDAIELQAFAELYGVPLQRFTEPKARER